MNKTPDSNDYALPLVGEIGTMPLSPQTEPLLNLPNTTSLLALHNIGLQRVNAALLSRNTFLEEDNRKFQTQNNRLKRDPVTGFYNRTGLECALEDGELQLSDNFLLLFLDVRGLKFVNDKGTHSAGDTLLQVVAKQISTVLTANVRSGSTALAGQERREHSAPTQPDIMCRFGGDEFIIIMQNILAAHAPEAAARLQALFSVKAALESHDTISLIASLSGAHSSELTYTPTTSLGRFSATHKLASDRHEAIKTAQYDEMWSRLKTASWLGRVLGKFGRRRPAEDRIIAEQFFNTFLQQFFPTLLTLAQNNTATNDAVSIVENS